MKFTPNALLTVGKVCQQMVFSSWLLLFESLTRFQDKECENNECYAAAKALCVH